MNRLKAVWLPLVLLFLSCVLVAFSPSLLFTMFVGIPACAIFWLDLRGRERDFHNLMKIRSKPYVWRRRETYLWDQYKTARCSRNVMCAVDPQARSYYRMLGYRWYHFFPDDSFTRDSPFLSWNFWMTISRSRE